MAEWRNRALPELPTKLGKVQDELKKLREQLASVEAAKKDAQVVLEEAKKRVSTKGSPAASAVTSPLFTTSVPVASAKKTEELKVPPPAAEEEEEISRNSLATNVFEVVRPEPRNIAHRGGSWSLEVEGANPPAMRKPQNRRVAADPVSGPRDPVAELPDLASPAPAPPVASPFASPRPLLRASPSPRSHSPSLTHGALL